METKDPGAIIYGGEQYEADLLGVVPGNPEYLKALESKKQPSNNPGLEYFVDRNSAFELAEKFQPINRETGEPADPAEPQKPLLRDLKEEVGDQLSGLGVKDEDIKVYTAVGTPLDTLHGVDVFFKIKDLRITIDITKRESKENSKADIMIYGELPDPAFNEDEYLERIGEIAKEIATFYKEKIQSKKRPRVATWTAPGFEDKIRDAG